ncbi:MAG: hypothetical protein KF716_02875 [Anaerolineae bacterium]|nr:hypothetical protein [Anaerolineae bacterium]
MTLALPHPVSAQEAWQEGAYLTFNACGLQSSGYRVAELTATKSIDRTVPSRTSNFTLYMESGVRIVHQVSTLIGPVTVPVPIDVDYLSVSRDLGWAGLDGSVVVFDAANNENVTVDVHLQWVANAGVVQQGSLYKRAATITGTLTLRGFNWLSPCGLSGYIYSTREPKPRY